jgi:Cu(I)/Ag(I) efflux system membrane fusion protein
VFEQDIGLVKTGAKAKVTINAYPNQVFEGRITYVYPTMKAETRTLAVRIELANPGQLLKPAMYAQVELPVGGTQPVLAVPDSAVIDSGTRRIVLVQIEEGRYEPREVELGARGENHVEVLKGVRQGEQVVVAANFLIDAESNLKAAVGGLAGHAGHGGAPKGTAPAASAAPSPKSVPVGHKAEGSVSAIDLKAGTLSLDHGPVASLRWPAMTMEFKAANASLLQGLKPGQAVSFEFVERQPGEYVVTSVAAAARTPAAEAVPATPVPGSGKSSHSGH